MPPIDRLAQYEIDIEALQGITLDSRCVQEGYLFAALQGEKADGRDFIGEALKNGARVILTDKQAALPRHMDLEGIKLIRSDNPRRDLSMIAAQFYAPLPENLVAVTGTNGKSSVVHFTAQLWQHEAIKGVMLGTLNNALTTPDPVTLFETLGRLRRDDDVTHVAMETSSHGLAQCRVDGALFKVAAFTNFTQDHLDYHSDMQSYFSAKARLFEEVLPIDGVAVLNADIKEYNYLSQICKKRGIQTLSYGKQGRDIILHDCQIDGMTQKTDIEVLGTRYKVDVPLIGTFQVMNILCALGCVIALDPEDKLRTQSLIKAIPKLKSVPGRLQHVKDASGFYNGYVDYAHTPDALETALSALRLHTDQRMICVFGCGGDRDKTKRPLMGEIAARLADIIIITDDNPRSEDPAIIREEIAAGIPEKIKNNKEIHVIEGRRAAIEQAAWLMDKNDTVLLAGKGHEQGQKIGDLIYPFDDATELYQAMVRRKTA
ncbi:MAG: UDP-N-acetylmuramoyl-L-alanyl-D-glutamate--2,6-diaminopimelate ligase [Alphaproteobacteria bacterium]